MNWTRIVGGITFELAKVKLFVLRYDAKSTIISKLFYLLLLW